MIDESSQQSKQSQTSDKVKDASDQLPPQPRANVGTSDTSPGKENSSQQLTPVKSQVIPVNEQADSEKEDSICGTELADF